MDTALLVLMPAIQATAEAETLVKAFVSGGSAALRKALVGVAPTGTVAVGAGAATPIRIAIERPTSDGRLLTLVTDKPVLFIGGGRSLLVCGAEKHLRVWPLLGDEAGGG